MARTLPLDKPGTVRLLGVAFLALMLFIVWVTYAFFNNKFVDSEPVYVTTQRTGVNLPKNADVKLRGMIVGKVSTIEPDGSGVKMTLAMKPEMLDKVPRDVSAQLLPKTLFGEKYLALIPDDGASDARLQAGDTITRASVPIEIEALLNDTYPLLNSVDPANLSYTLTAVSEALTGRGDDLGDTLVTANEYLGELNPDVPLLIDDIEKLGRVADGYTAAMPNLGRLLRNSTTTAKTIQAKESELAAFLRNGTKLSNTLTRFTKTNGETIIELNRASRPLLEIVAAQSPTIPCFLKGARGITPILDSAFRDQMLHINIDIIKQPTPYREDERLIVDKETFEKPAAAPTCLELDEINKAHGSDDNPATDDRSPYGTKDEPFKVPSDVYNLVNLKDDHNKFPDGTGSANRPAAAGSMDAIAANKIIAASNLGVDVGDVPDLSALMLQPVTQGKVVIGR